VADAGSYTPSETIDAVVFNEMFYYFDRPDEVLRQHAAFLRPGGFYVLSLWDGPESAQAWKRASPAMAVDDEVQIRNAKDVSWTIRMGRPQLSPG
jgi:SAM-dependent methyltransferase